MAANIAEADSSSPIQVNHARQVVDRVTLLRERVKRQERAIEAVIVERDKALECCEMQKQVIADLQLKLDSRPVRDRDALSAVSNALPMPALPMSALSKRALVETVDNDVVDIAELDLLSDSNLASRGGDFSHTAIGKPANRVSSMRAALLRIGGVEVPDAGEPVNAAQEEEFDASEFQPIAEDEESSVRQVVAGVYSRLASIAGTRRELSDIESDGLQTSR